MSLINIILILFSVRVIFTQNNACGTYCSSCSFGSCTQCNQHFTLNAQQNLCVSDCSSSNYYYDQQQNKCSSICPYGYQEQDQQYICSKNIQCPQLSMQGNQIEQIIQATVVNQNELVLFQYSSINNNYYLSLYDSNNFIILGSLSPVQQQYNQLYYDQQNVQFLSANTNWLVYWNIYNWKQTNQLNLALFVSNCQYISYLDNQIIIIQSTTYNQFTVIYHTQSGTPSYLFQEYNNKGNVNINRIFSDTLLYSQSQQNGFFIRSLNLQTFSLNSTQICSAYTPLTPPVGVTSQNSNFIFFTEQKGNIVSWNVNTGCTLITLNPIIISSQMLVMSVDSINDLVNILTLNTNSISYFNINLTSFKVLQSSTYAITSPLNIQYISSIIYVINSSGQQFLLQIQSNQLALLQSNQMQKFNNQMFIQSLYIKNTLFTIFKNSIVASKVSLTSPYAISFQNQLSDISPYQTQENKSINGVIIDSNYNDQILTYNSDGSIRIYQRNLINQRYQLILQQVYYHPTCQFSASTGNSAFQCYNITNIVYSSSQYIVTYMNTAQLSTTSNYFVSTWSRAINSLTYQSDFTLNNPQQPIVNTQILNGMFLVGNQIQIRVYSFTNGQIQVDFTTSYYFAAFDNIYNQNQLIIIYSTTIQTFSFSNKSNPTNTLQLFNIYQFTSRYTYFTKALYYSQTKKLVFTFTVGIVIVTFNGGSPGYEYIDCSLIHDFCYHPYSQQVFLQQLEYKRIQVWQEVGNTNTESLQFAGSTSGLTCGSSSSSYFYSFLLVPLVPTLENTVYVIMMPNMNVVFQQSYKETVTGVYLNEAELILYVTFLNGEIYSGKIILDNFITSPSITNLYSLMYAPNNRYLASSAINNNQAQLTTINSLNLQIQKQVYIPSVNSFSFTLLNEQSSLFAIASGSNIYIWSLTTNNQPYQLQQLHQNTVNNLIIDGVNLILVSVSIDFQMYVWNLSNNQNLFAINYHKSDSQGITQFSIGSIFLDITNTIILSYNSQNILYLQNYKNQQLLRVNLNSFNLIAGFQVIPETQNVLIISQNSDFSLSLYSYSQTTSSLTFNENKMIPVNHSQAPITIKFINNMIISYELSKLIVTSFSTFKVVYEIDAINPKINNLLVSLKNNQLIIWSDCSSFCSPTVQIFNFQTGEFIMNVPYYNDIEEGLVISILLDEDTNTLVLVKYPSFVVVQFFNIQTLQPSGIIYTQNIPLNLPISSLYLVRENSNLVFSSGSQIYVYNIEQKIGDYKQFITQLRNQHIAQISSDATSFFIVDAYSEAWQYNSVSNQLTSITKQMQNSFNTQAKAILTNTNFIYVIFFDSIIQLDYTLKQLNSVLIPIDQYCITSNYLYISNILGVITQYNEATLTQTTLSITLDSRAILMINFSFTSEIVVLSAKNTIYRISVSSGAYQAWIYSAIQLTNLLIDNVKNIIIIVRSDGNISFFDSSTWQNTASQTITLNSCKLLPSALSTIYSVFLDTQLGQVLVLDQISNQVNQIYVYGYTFVAGGTTTLTGISSLGSFSSSSKLPFVNLIISNSNYIMLSGSSITWIDRQSFKVTRFLRNSGFFKDILSIIEVSTSVISNTFFILETNQISLYYSTSQTSLNLLYQHQCSFPQLLNYSYSVRLNVQDIEVQVVGFCGEGVFNDKVYISDPSVKLNTINSCYVQSNTQFQYQFDNNIEDLGVSLSMLNMSPSVIVFEQLQQTDFSELAIGNNNTTELLTFRNINNAASILNITDNYFIDYPYQKLQLEGYTLDVSYVQQSIQFGSSINQIVMSDIQITLNNAKSQNPSPSTSFIFSNLDSVVLQNINITNQDFQRSQPLFIFSNISTGVFIDNLEFSFLQISGSMPTLIVIQNCTLVQINSLTLNNISFLSSVNPTQNYIINIQDVFDFKLTNSNFASIEVSVTQLLLIKCLGIRNIFLQKTSISTIQGISFIEFSNYFFEGDQEMLVNDSQVYINTLTANNINQLSNPFMFFNNTYNSTIQSSIFNQISCTSCTGSVVNMFQGSIYYINSSQFNQNIGQNGGAIGIQESTGELNIIGSSFLKNQVSYSGGAIYIQNSLVNIVSSTIQNNIAMIGGGVRYDSIKPTIDSSTSRILQQASTLQQSVISNNVASVFGNNIGSYLYNMQIVDSKFQKISEQQIYGYNPQWQSQLSGKVMNAYLSQQFRSGDSLSINIQLLDEESNPVKININSIKLQTLNQNLIQEVSNFQAKASPLNGDNLKVFGQYQTDYTYYNSSTNSFLINTKVVSNPLSTNILLVQYSIQASSNINIQGEQMYSVIVIQFRNCIEGEVFQQLDQVYSCYQCPDGQYSLVQPTTDIQTCTVCPDSASDCYEDQILLKSGYWRLNVQSEVIVQCSRKLVNCIPDSNHNYCIQGNYGPLCESCDTQGVVWGEGYQADGNLNCNSCTKLFKGFYFTGVMIQVFCVFLFVGISVAASIYDSKAIILGYYLRKTKMISISKSCYLNSTSFGLKNLTNYLQMISIIYEVVFQQFPTGSTYVSSAIGMPLTNLIYSLDCFLSTKSSFPIIYIRTLWGMLLAFGFFLAVTLSLMIYSIKRKQTKRILIYHGLIYTYFFLQSNVTYILFSMMSCRTIGDSEYILADVSYECYTPTHLKFMKLIGIPSILIWCFMIPLFLYFQMKRAILQPDYSFHRETYGMLYNHYKLKYFYWEIVKFFKKVALNAVLVFYIQPIVNKFVFVLLLQLLFLILLSKTKPHYLSTHYVIEYLQEFILTVKVVFCIFIETKNSLSEQQNLLYFEIGVSSLFQIAFLIQTFQQLLKKRYENTYFIVKNFFFKYIPKCKMFIKESSLKRKNGMTHLLRWKKLRIQIKEILQQEQNENLEPAKQQPSTVQPKTIRSYRSKLEEIGKLMKESSSLFMRKGSYDANLLLSPPQGYTSRKVSETNVMLKSQQHSQFVLTNRRITEQNNLIEETPQTLRTAQMETEYFQETSSNKSPQDMLGIYQFVAQRQSKNSHLNFMGSSDYSSCMNQSNKLLNTDNIQEAETPNLIKFDECSQDKIQMSTITKTKSDNILKQQTTIEVNSPQLLKFDSEELTHENLSPLQMIKYTSNTNQKPSDNHS